MKIHFSIDDVIGCFLWLTKNKCSTIFESRIFSFAKNLYDNYGIHTVCNCMYSNGVSSLQEVSSDYVEEFQQNAHWLKFSFHCFNHSSNYTNTKKEDFVYEYNLVMSELTRITGGAATLSTDVRLHCFTGNSEIMNYLAESGIKQIFTADDNRISYDLSIAEEIHAKQDMYISPLNNLTYIATDIRLEKDETTEYLLNHINSSKKLLVIFTHEIYIGNANIQNKLFEICDYFKVNP